MKRGEHWRTNMGFTTGKKFDSANRRIRGIKSVVWAKAFVGIWTWGIVMLTTWLGLLVLNVVWALVYEETLAGTTVVSKACVEVFPFRQRLVDCRAQGCVTNQLLWPTSLGEFLVIGMITMVAVQIVIRVLGAWFTKKGALAKSSILVALVLVVHQIAFVAGNLFFNVTNLKCAVDPLAHFIWFKAQCGIAFAPEMVMTLVQVIGACVFVTSLLLRAVYGRSGGQACDGGNRRGTRDQRLTTHDP